MKIVLQRRIRLWRRNWKLKIVLAVCFFLLSASSVSASTINMPPPLNTSSGLVKGLVGWWTMDGKDTLQNIVDRSGQGNTGNLVHGGSGTTTAPGKIGQAMKFDGVDDYVNVPNASSMDSMEGSSQATVAFWVKRLTPASSGQSYVSRYNGTLGRHFIVQGDEFFPLRPFWRYGGSGTGGNAIDHTCNTSTCPLPVGQWRHVVVTYSDPTSSIYVDGVLKTTKDGTGGVLNTSITAPIIIGANDSFANIVNALIDDVRIYNRALSAAEVTALYRTTGGGRVSTTNTKTAASGNPLAAGLVGHWTFDGKNLLQNAADSSGQGNTGYLTNFTSTTTAPGKIGQALSFDGVDDYVGSIRPSIRTSASNQTHSISLWFKTSASINAPMLGAGNGSTPNTGVNADGGIGWRSDNGNLAIELWTGSAQYATADGTYRDGKWHHVISVLDSVSLRLYVDGVLKDTNTSANTSNAFTYSSNPYYLLGAANRSFGDMGNTVYYSGQIDDVRIYNRALSAAEVKQLYNLGR